MEDSQKGKERGQYNQWSPQETKLLIDLLVDAINRNWRDANGSINKQIVERKILPVLNERLGCQKTHIHYLSRMKYLRTTYQNYLDLQRFNSGFGWDPEMKRFTAPDEVWDKYLKKHPTHKHLRYESNKKFDDLQLIFGCAVATGGFAIGMGDTTDARTLRVGESNQVRDDVNLHHNNDDFFELSSQCGKSVFLDTNPKGSVEKLNPRKRAKIENTSDIHKVKHDQENLMIIVGSKILSVIQQREERQQREAEKREEKLQREAKEKEVEKKKENMWEAMKEIPNLDNHTRYKAITLIHSFFMDMNPEERFGWIQSNVSSI